MTGGQPVAGARRLSPSVLWPALGVFAVVVGIFSLSLGAASIGPGSVVRVLFAPLAGGLEGPAGLASIVVWDIRLPRLACGFLVGAGLAVSGATLQGLFRNPLADPALIGVSSGAAIGGVTALVVVPLLAASSAAEEGFPAFLVGLLADAGLPVLAMGGAVGFAFVVYRISLVGGRVHVPSMLLTGIAMNAIGGAFVGLVLTVFASDEQIRSVTFWTLGSLSGSNWSAAGLIAALVLPGLVVAFRLAPALNALLLGEVEARHLGVRVDRVRRGVIVVSALMVGVTVAFCGIIGFVGLVIPHMIRTVCGPDHRLLLPAAALLGGSGLAAADVLARTLVAPAELQIGVLTALVGGPFFLYLLSLARRGRPVAGAN